MTERPNALLDIALSCIAFLSPEERAAVARAVGSARELEGLSLGELGAAAGRQITRASWKPAQVIKTAERCLKACEARGWKALRIGTPG